MLIPLIMFDFTKAFDRANYGTLFNKLKKYGFDDGAINWLRSYLVGRKQRELAGKEMSEWERTENGVPQGSVLGLLVFLIYVNDISTSLNSCKHLHYADDLEIYMSFPIEKFQAAMTLLQSVIDLLAHRCHDNSLTLNTDKKLKLYTSVIKITLNQLSVCFP